MTYCAKCGAPLPPGAQFCPRCGAPLNVSPPEPPNIAPPPRVAPPPATPPRAAPQPATPPPAAPPPARARTWWIVPLVLLGLGGLAWLLLAGLPFGGREDDRPAPPAVETIAEGTAPPPATPRETGTVIDVPGEEDDEYAVTTMTAERPPNTTPPDTTPPDTTPPTATQPPRTATQPPPATAQPRPTTTRPPEPAPVEKPAPPAERVVRSGQITDSEGAGLLRSYITSRDYYDVSGDCLRIESRGFRNRGYGYEVWHSCGGGASRLLGRWRVDSLTREIFRQQDDGRYLRP